MLIRELSSGRASGEVGYVADPRDFNRVYDTEKNSELVRMTRDLAPNEVMYSFYYRGADFHIEGTLSVLDADKIVSIDLPMDKVGASFYQRHGMEIDHAQAMIDDEMLAALREAIIAVDSRRVFDRFVREGWRVRVKFQPAGTSR